MTLLIRNLGMRSFEQVQDSCLYDEQFMKVKHDHSSTGTLAVITTMQRIHCSNSSPTSVALCNRDIRKVIYERDIDCTLNLCKATKGKVICLDDHQDNVKVVSCFVDTDKKQKRMEEEIVSNETVVVSTSQPTRVVYKSALQAFMQQLLAEENHTSIAVVPVADDSVWIDSSQQRQQSHFHDIDIIPELQESYASSDHVATKYDGGGDYYRFDSFSTVDDDSGDDDHHDEKFSDLPPLIDMSREIRSFM